MALRSALIYTRRNLQMPDSQNPSLVDFPRNTNPAHTLTLYIFTFNFNIIVYNTT
jgi:hypothetical protein